MTWVSWCQRFSRPPLSSCVSLASCCWIVYSVYAPHVPTPKVPNRRAHDTNAGADQPANRKEINKLKLHRCSEATYLTIVAQANITAIAIPIGMRTRINRCIILFRPVWFGLLAGHLAIFLLQLCKRFVTHLQTRIGSIDLAHDFLFAA